MTNVTMKTQAVQHDGEATVDLFDAWFDPIETSLRERVRGFIEQVIEAELVFCHKLLNPVFSANLIHWLDA